MKILAHDPRISFTGRDGSYDDAVVVREIFCENVYEVQPSDVADTGVVVDLGANIGAFSIFAARLSDRIKVYAVEPEPHNLKLLHQNLADNHISNVQVIELGMSNYDGTALITDEEAGSYLKDSTVGAKVEVVTLQTLWGRLNLSKVDVLKIDVEGSESDILLATPGDILQGCRYITLEFDTRGANKLGDLVAKLSETHQLKVVGSHLRGGMIFARRY